MSAIAGFFHRDGRPADPGLLTPMVERLSRWGPDNTRAQTCGPLGLVQLLLATTPEAYHPSPARDSPTDGLLIAADVRLDNRNELAAALGIRSDDLGNTPDDRLILRAYRAWGRSCPERLLGDFAFAIWDRERRCLFCARDPIGVRPFYYHASGALFAFGTQIEPLFAVPGVPRRLSDSTLGDYLALLPPDKEKTFYHGVVRLHPGSSIEVSPDSLSVRKYWELDDTKRLRLGSDTEYVEAFKAVFSDAVRARLRGSSGVGAMLSGGLDSSAIVGVAREISSPGSRLVTLSGTFPAFRDTGHRVDERAFVEKVVSGGGLDPQYVALDRASPLFDFLWKGEEPLPAASLYMDWAVLRSAHEKGLRVILSGNDGDSVVGYGRAFLTELAWRLRWTSLLRELRALSTRYQVGRRSLLAEWVLPTLVPRGLRVAAAQFQRRNGPIYDVRSFIRTDFAERAGVVGRAREAIRDDQIRRRERKAHRMHIDSPLLTLLLEVFARATAEFSIEPRYPFLDRRLMEFCLSLPGDQKLHDGWDRVVMRRAMEGLVPAEIQWRESKQDLTPNFNLRLLESREILDDLILGEPFLLEPYVDVRELRSAYDRYLAEPGTSRWGFAIFWTVVFGLWLRHSGISR